MLRIKHVLYQASPVKKMLIPRKIGYMAFYLVMSEYFLIIVKDRKYKTLRKNVGSRENRRSRDAA